MGEIDELVDAADQLTDIEADALLAGSPGGAAEAEIRALLVSLKKLRDALRSHR